MYKNCSLKFVLGVMVSILDSKPNDESSNLSGRAKMEYGAAWCGYLPVTQEKQMGSNPMYSALGRFMDGR